MIDPDNPVVQLCLRGVEAETAGRLDDARAAYDEAWEAATDAYESCIAAHYVARLQADPGARIAWNRRALDAADAVADGRAAGFGASLALNLGSAHEDAGDPASARAWYARARERLVDVPEGAYRESVERGVGNAERRVSGAGGMQVGATD